MRRCSLLCHGLLPLGGSGTAKRRWPLLCRASIAPRTSTCRRPCVRAFSTGTSHELVRLHVQAHVATITLQNPAKLNPLTVGCGGDKGAGKEEEGGMVERQERKEQHPQDSPPLYGTPLHDNRQEELGTQFQAVVQEIAEDTCRDIRCVVLTGAGKAFSVSKETGGKANDMEGSGRRGTDADSLLHVQTYEHAHQNAGGRGFEVAAGPGSREGPRQEHVRPSFTYTAPALLPFLSTPILLP